jgi:hypothetical protein
MNDRLYNELMQIAKNSKHPIDDMGKAWICNTLGIRAV